MPNVRVHIYFNPRPPRGGRPHPPTISVKSRKISIHAPREGGDLLFQRRLNAVLFISIHAPREGGDDPTAEVLLSS